MTISRKGFLVISALLLAYIGIMAQTLVNVSNQVTGILAVANGGTGVATANASTIFGRSFLDGNGAPHFFTPAMWDFGYMPDASVARVSTLWATGAGVTEYGDAFTAAGTGSNVAASSTLPTYNQTATTTTNGNVASLSGNLSYRVGSGLNYFVQTAQSSTGAQRMWRGLTDQTAATMAGSDNPAGNYAAITYCNDGANAGCSVDNTQWQFCVKDNSTQSCTTTNVNADTNFHTWWIHEDPGVNWTAYEYSSGAWVSRAVRSSNTPTSGATLRYVMSTTCMTCTPTAQNQKQARQQIVVLNSPW